MANPGERFTPHTYRAWGDLMHVANRKVPHAIRQIEISQRRLLQRLSHHRRVRH